MMQQHREEEEELLLLMRREDEYPRVSTHEEEEQRFADEVADKNNEFENNGETEGIEVAPNVDNDEDDMRDVEPEPEPEVALLGSSTASARTPSETNTIPYIFARIKNIQLDKDTICGQWRECVWDEKKLSI
jgi:hypothetical protein